MTNAYGPRFSLRLVHDALRLAAEAHPDKIAIVADDTPTSYAEFFAAAQQQAREFRSRGVTAGDRVALHLDNTADCAIAIYATLFAGGVVMVVNPHTKPDKLDYVLRDSGAKLLVAEPHLLSRYRAELEPPPGLTLRTVGDDDDGAPSGAPGVNVAQHDASTTEVAQNVAPGVHVGRFGAQTAGVAQAGLEPDTLPSALAALIYTSGSTGGPKGVMVTHQSMVFTLETVSRYLRLGPDDRILNVLPFAYSYGLYQLLMSVALGATLVLERSFSFPAQIIERIQAQQATVFPGVPTMFSTLIERKRAGGLRLPSVTRVTNAAAALPQSFVAELQEIFPNALIFQMYGLTECKRVSYLEPELLADKPGSVGKPMVGTEVFLADEHGVPTLPGEIGLLHVRGPHVMMGYWGDPVRTARALRQGRGPEDRILCTGDYFRLDGEGFLYFVGRSDDVIMSGGEKISPSEIEDVLYAIPGVRDAAAIGVPDGLLGEAVRAYVVLKEGSALTERQIRRACIARLERALVPKAVVILDDLPRTLTGKIQKKALREQYGGAVD